MRSFIVIIIWSVGYLLAEYPPSSTKGVFGWVSLVYLKIHPRADQRTVKPRHVWWDPPRCHLVLVVDGVRGEYFSFIMIENIKVAVAAAAAAVTEFINNVVLPHKSNCTPSFGDNVVTIWRLLQSGSKSKCLEEGSLQILSGHDFEGDDGEEAGYSCLPDYDAR